MPGSPVLSRVTQAHIDARLEAILGAAEALFARKGIDRTTMQEIAAEAGISAGAIYRYYPSKEHLLEAVFAHVGEMHAEMFASAAAAHDSPAAALMAIGQQELAATVDHDCALWLESQLAGLRDPNHAGHAHRRLVDESIGGVRALLDRAQQAGEVPAGTDLDAMAMLLYAAVVGLKIRITEGLPVEAAERALAVLGGLFDHPPGQ